MRIHSLTMTGIGPYAGREHIDFDAVGASGRFLLTGPTGSGKTTIIDAIVFALYGDVADSADSSKERIRSTLVGPHTESVIELVFSTGAGVYRVRRTPTYERAKRRGQGTTTQNGTVKLWHLAEVGGEPLDEPVTRVGDADAEIARAVGLSREQFTQTVVLPQGKFARFLRADSSERQHLLKDVFGTGIYDAIQDALIQASRDGARQVEQAAADLTGARQELAEQLEAAVTAELEGLQMRGARLVVELTPLAEPGPTGAETVALLLAAHPGAPALPLGKGASGGELSRIMLALEVVLAQSETDPQEAGRSGPAHGRTFVFDEVDAGVGGRAALEVGRRLARLARSHQVVVVTHLAQVAAWASTQLVVLKEVDAARDGAPTTSTRVVPVTGQDRVRELARMLSGHEDSEAALRHAAELLAEAGVAESLT